MNTSKYLNILFAIALVAMAAKLFRANAAPAVAAITDQPSATGVASPSDAAIPATANTKTLSGHGPVRGFNGPVPVEISIRDGAVTSVSPVLPNDESPMFFSRLEEADLWNRWNGLSPDVAATSHVDAVTGATFSSKAAIASVQTLLAAEAGITPVSQPPAHAQTISLPPPNRASMPLGEALLARKTIRDFSSSSLSDQELSDLLWAANGFNRPGKRTAPTAINRQEIDLYICREDGAYRWESSNNTLVLASSKDLRGLTGRMRDGSSNFALAAPVAIVYVIDYERQGLQSRPRDAAKYSCVDCGFIGQNIYLHCAATGLGTVFLGSLNPDEIAKALQLPPHQVPLFAQTVGKPL